MLQLRLLSVGWLDVVSVAVRILGLFKGTMPRRFHPSLILIPSGSPLNRLEYFFIFSNNLATSRKCSAVGSSRKRIDSEGTLLQSMKIASF